MQTNQDSNSIQDLPKCTVAIQRSSDGRVLGTGVIVANDGLILTCYHVVGDIKNKTIDEIVDIYFPSIPEIRGRAQPIKQYCDPELDVAFLQLQEKLPEQTTVAIAVLGETVTFGNPFTSFAFRKAGAQFIGLHSRGEIRAKTSVKGPSGVSRELIQLYSDEIEEGMAGAPVLDTRYNKIIGIIGLRSISAKSDARLAFAIPVDSIVRVYPILREKNPGISRVEQTAQEDANTQYTSVSAKWTTKNELLTHIATDRWTTKDELGYDTYAYAIAKFLTDKQTEAPISISIQAPWGGGKTSLMRMVRSMIDTKAPGSSIQSSVQPEERVKLKHLKRILKVSKDEDKHHPEPQHPESIRRTLDPRMTIWFNAWKYESTEQVWAGLADSIVKGVADRMQTVEREWFYLRLNLRRRDIDSIRSWITDHVWSYVWKKATPWILTSIIGLGISFLTGITQWIHGQPIFASGGFLGAAAFSGLGIAQTLSKKLAVEEESTEVSLGDFVKVPDYNEKLGFIHHVVRDLELVFETIPKDYQKLVIFIDDLDRCSPTKVAQVIEGVNLFLAREFPGCIFVIGMDAEMVAAALEVSHKDVVSNLPSYSTDIPIGWRFMDKFVQLPFVLYMLFPLNLPAFLLSKP